MSEEKKGVPFWAVPPSYIGVDEGVGRVPGPESDETGDDDGEDRYAPTEGAVSEGVAAWTDEAGNVRYFKMLSPDVMGCGEEITGDEYRRVNAMFEKKSEMVVFGQPSDDSVGFGDEPDKARRKWNPEPSSDAYDEGDEGDDEPDDDGDEVDLEEEDDDEEDFDEDDEDDPDMEPEDDEDEDDD